MTAVGFTGSRTGVTQAQARPLYAHLEHLRRSGHTEFRHGDCVGADIIGAATAHRVGFWIIGHPPQASGYRAWYPSNQILPPQPYLDRNRAIVDASDVLIACPDGLERLRSGTWSTVRYARRSGRQTIVIMPDGSVVE